MRLLFYLFFLFTTNFIYSGDTRTYHQNVSVGVYEWVRIVIENIQFNQMDFYLDYNASNQYVYMAEANEAYSYQNNLSGNISKNIRAKIVDSLPTSWSFTVNLSELVNDSTATTTPTTSGISQGDIALTTAYSDLVTDISGNFTGSGTNTVKLEIIETDYFSKNETGYYLIEYITEDAA